MPTLGYSGNNASNPFPNQDHQPRPLTSRNVVVSAENSPSMDVMGRGRPDQNSRSFALPFRPLPVHHSSHPLSAYFSLLSLALIPPRPHYSFLTDMSRATRSFAAAAESMAPVYGHVPSLLAPMHPYAPVGVLDLFGAARLSMGVNWIASDTKGLPRASFLQEALGMLVVVFGGETFLGASLWCRCHCARLTRLDYRVLNVSS